MNRILNLSTVIFFLVFGIVSSALCMVTVELLTPEEAALPESKSAGFASDPQSDGPTISVTDVEVDKKQRSFPLIIGFNAKGGGAVDLTTLKLECLKSTPIDLTARIKQYADREGVRIVNVSLPPGMYRFRVGIGDVNGRFSAREFVVKFSSVF